MLNHRAKYDAVTVGQIRARRMKALENHLKDLNGMLTNEGYHALHKAEALLKGDIAEILTQMQNLDSWASTETIFPQKDSNA